MSAKVFLSVTAVLCILHIFMISTMTPQGYFQDCSPITYSSIFILSFCCIYNPDHFSFIFTPQCYPKNVNGFGKDDPSQG